MIATAIAIRCRLGHSVRLGAGVVVDRVASRGPRRLPPMILCVDLRRTHAGDTCHG